MHSRSIEFWWTYQNTVLIALLYNWPHTNIIVVNTAKRREEEGRGAKRREEKRTEHNRRLEQKRRDILGWVKSTMSHRMSYVLAKSRSCEIDSDRCLMFSNRSENWLASRGQVYIVNQQESSILCNWFSLRRLGPWTNHLPPDGPSWWRHQMEPFSASLAFVWGIHRSAVNSPHKGQWRGALMLSLICTWINARVNTREAGDLRRHHAHCDVIVMGVMVHFLFCVFQNDSWCVILV